MRNSGLNPTLQTFLKNVAIIFNNVLNHMAVSFQLNNSIQMEYRRRFAQLVVAQPPPQRPFTPRPPDDNEPSYSHRTRSGRTGTKITALNAIILGHIVPNSIGKRFN